MTRRSVLAQISPTEIIATISRSAYPAVITEGEGDVIVLRRLEEEFYEESLTIIPANGKAAVLEVFVRRNELPAKAKVVFIVDQDLWILTGIPRQYLCSRLLLTRGHSIENDMFVDGDFEKLLTVNERQRFQEELRAVCHWYGLAVYRRIYDADQPIAIHPNRLLDNEGERKRLTALEANELYPIGLHDQIYQDYQRLLRGKTLLELFVRNSKEHKYSYESLLNLGAARNGPNLASITSRVRSYLQTDHPAAKSGSLL